MLNDRPRVLCDSPNQHFAVKPLQIVVPWTDVPLAKPHDEVPRAVAESVAAKSLRLILLFNNRELVPDDLTDPLKAGSIEANNARASNILDLVERVCVSLAIDLLKKAGEG